MFLFFFFKQKTAYELRISDWSSDVCSSDLPGCNGLLLISSKIETWRPPSHVNVNFEFYRNKRCACYAFSCGGTSAPSIEARISAGAMTGRSASTRSE